MKRLDNIIVVKYQKYIVIKREQAQNAIRLLVQNANDRVRKMNRVILFYLIDINVKLAIQKRKKPLKIRLIVHLPLVVKFKMTYSKMKLRDVN